MSTFLFHTIFCFQSSDTIFIPASDEELEDEDIEEVKRAPASSKKSHVISPARRSTRRSRQLTTPPHQASSSIFDIPVTPARLDSSTGNILVPASDQEDASDEDPTPMMVNSQDDFLDSPSLKAKTQRATRSNTTSSPPPTASATSRIRAIAMSKAQMSEKLRGMKKEKEKAQTSSSKTKAKSSPPKRSMSNTQRARMREQRIETDLSEETDEVDDPFALSSSASASQPTSIPSMWKTKSKKLTQSPSKNEESSEFEVEEIQHKKRTKVSKTKPKGRKRAKQVRSSSEEAVDDESDFQPSPKKKRRRIASSRQPSQSQANTGSPTAAPPTSSQDARASKYQLPLFTQARTKSSALLISSPASPASSSQTQSQSKVFRKADRKHKYKDLTKSNDEEEDDGSEVMIVGKPTSSKPATKKQLAEIPMPPSFRKAATLNLISQSHTHLSPNRTPSPIDKDEIDSKPAQVPSILWIDKYAPRTEDDLCIHNRKLEEVRIWIQRFGLPLPPPNARHLFNNASGQMISGKEIKTGHGQTMLVLTGPPGSMKTAMIRVLASSLGYQIVTWDGGESVGSSRFENFGSSSSSNWDPSIDVPYESKLARFRNFFCTATRYALPLVQSVDSTHVAKRTSPSSSVLQSAPASSALVSTPAPVIQKTAMGGLSIRTPPKTMVVIEGKNLFRIASFQNNSHCLKLSCSFFSLILFFFVPPLDLPSFGRDQENERAEFLSILSHAVHTSKHPIVMILTTTHETTSGEHVVEKALGKDMLMHQKLHIINTNPISVTGLTKAIKRVIDGEHLHLPSNVLHELLHSCAGDVRRAISTLQFYAVHQTAKNIDDEQLGMYGGRKGSKSKSKKKPNTKSKSSTVDTEDSDSTVLNLFGDHDETFSIFHGVGKILHAKSTESRDIAEIIQSTPVTPLQFLEWIYTNYIEYLNPPLLTATQQKQQTQKTFKTSATSHTSASLSAGATIPSSSPPPGTSFFDDVDDFDFDTSAFDAIVNKATSAATAAANLGVKQSQLDEEALQAIVDATRHFSDADILAQASTAQYGDVSLTEIIISAISDFLHQKLLLILYSVPIFILFSFFVLLRVYMLLKRLQLQKLDVVDLCWLNVDVHGRATLKLIRKK